MNDFIYKFIRKSALVFLLILFLFFLTFMLSACGNSNNQSNQANYTADRLSSTNQSFPDNTSQNNDDNKNIDTENNTTSESKDENKTETIAAEFSTQIKTKSKNRANNIKITCSKINGVSVNPGEEFSFCNTTGVSKESEGYKKADVIVDKKIIQALGGGNCQVSTTLYNAVLGVSELEVTERHPHGKKVNYVPEGKDAAIAHGSKDFKFKNNSDKALKIYASSDGTSVYVKLVFVS